jgi:putative efflux protein, MATE family
MTIGSVGNKIALFYIPVLLTSAFQQIYSFVDTLIVGQGLGDNALGAVGNMGSLMFFVFGFSMGLTNGFAVTIGQNFGASDEKALKKSVAASIRLSAIIAAILTVVSLMSLRGILGLLATPDEILNDSLKYGYVIFAGVVATIAYNLCSAVLRALGDSRTPFFAIVFSTIFNIVFDWISIFVLHMGVEGPAMVTVVAQVISVAICMRKLRTIDIIHPSRGDFAFVRTTDRTLLKNGIPMAAMNSITAIGCMIVQYFINGMGVEYTSAYAVCSRYLNLFMTPAQTAGQTMSTFASQNYGAGKIDRIKEGLRKCLIIALVAYVIFGSAMVFLPDMLAARMLSGSVQIELASGVLRRCGVMIFAVDMLFVIRSCCQGMGKPLIPMASGIAEMVLRIGVIVLFVPRLGLNAAAFAEIAAWVGALLMNSIAYFYHISRAQNGVGYRVPRKRELHYSAN